MMPGSRVMLVEVAAFPATVGPEDRPAAQRAGLGLLAGPFGGPVVCHLPDPSSLPSGGALTGMDGVLAIVAAARHRMPS
jgi:hypothetical protein